MAYNSASNKEKPLPTFLNGCLSNSVLWVHFCTFSDPQWPDHVECFMLTRDPKSLVALEDQVPCRRNPAAFQYFHTSPELASSSWVSPGFTWAVASNGAKGKENIESESLIKAAMCQKVWENKQKYPYHHPTSASFGVYHLHEEEFLFSP